MARNASQDLYEESFGSPDDQTEHPAEHADLSLEYLDRRDVQLEYWRFQGLFFPAMLVQLGKAWVVVLDVLLLLAILGFGLGGLWPVSMVLVVVMLVLAIYEYTSLDGWTDEHNERVSARREALRRREP